MSFPRRPAPQNADNQPVTPLGRGGAVKFGDMLLFFVTNDCALAAVLLVLMARAFL
jgi:hypothetical protein